MQVANLGEIEGAPAGIDLLPARPLMPSGPDAADAPSVAGN
jgi:hypothetical protein